jgi:DNA ligase D-like protein (predicted polymerase)/DNA ligase D-like protein (predicted 3'-phosphoesterase)
MRQKKGLFMKLSHYKSKRNLKVSNEPKALTKKTKTSTLVFVIQEHHASHLHYDLRLEAEGVLKSWAIPKEPSIDPSIKRLAIQVEDHPYSYKDFEGTIPSGYGAGTVSIWDSGTYDVDGLNSSQSEKQILAGLKKGSLHFTLRGKKLNGIFHLVRLKNKKEWLFIKKKNSSTSIKSPLTNLEKLYWPTEKISKGDLLHYYSSIASFILPHLKDRPQSLRRYPEGIKGPVFFQKNLTSHPSYITTTSIQQSEKIVHYLLINNEESLLYAVNLGCIELHSFFSRTASLEKPDYLVLDLDPKGASFSDVVLIAQEIHKLLDAIEVPSYPKTSGATGIHIAIPLGAKYTYSQSHQFAEILAMIIHRKLPHITTLERSISKREGKVYIDYHQNNLGQTLAAPYCVRAKPNATVSTPLKWAEVNKRLTPNKFTIKNIPSRLKKLGDLYAPTLGKGIDLQSAIHNLNLLVDRKKIRNQC